MTKMDHRDMTLADTDLLKAGLALEEDGLKLLWAEMQALAALIPGVAGKLPTDAETEDAFDNMPV